MTAVGMDVITDTIEGPFVLTRDSCLRGMVTNGLTVAAGVKLDLDGIVSGDVVVEAGAAVNIRGRVDGAVVNNAGWVSVFGTVGSLAGTHDSYVHRSAIIRAL
jgi:hypothetical protein